MTVANHGKNHCHQMNQRQMQQVIKQRHATNNQERLTPPTGRFIQPRQCHQRGAERHQQVKQRRRIFGAIEERENRKPPILLHRPRRRIAIHVHRTQDGERQGQHGSQPEQQLLTMLRFVQQEFAKTIAHRHHPNPRNQRIPYFKNDARHWL